MSDRVLVTGVSGFISAHVTERLLAKGYAVRGTVRNKAKGQKIVDALAANGSDVSKLELVQADLGSDAGWEDAVQDCRYIQHIASPFPLEAPSDREALVPEARAGAMRVIEHGLGAGAERIIMTSSMVSMMGQKGRGAHMLVKEDDWSDPDWKPLTAYPVSKTRAEKAAWDYVKTQGLSEKLTTICPGLVFGPDTYKNGGASLGLIIALFNGDFPRTPKIAYPIIDVRDCAAIHVAAMTAERAGGRRLMAASETLWFSKVGEILKAKYPQANKLPKGVFPNFMVRMVGLFDDRVKGVIPDLGVFHEADSAYVNSITRVIPRPAKEAILSAAESLIENGTLRFE
jgi:nucleoside-diphosphate-sugar epimerase